MGVTFSRRPNQSSIMFIKGAPDDVIENGRRNPRKLRGT